MIRSRALRSFALVLAAFTAVSCGDPTSSIKSESADDSVSLSYVVGLPFALVGEEVKTRAVRWSELYASDHDETVSALIGASGGKISIPESDFTMIVPEGALSAATRISVTAGGGRHVKYDMRPHGLQFLKPVAVIQGLQKTETYGTEAGNGVRSAYLAPTNEQIGEDDSAFPAELPAATTLFQGVIPVAQTHTWYLTHFSRYILISGVLVKVD